MKTGSRWHEAVLKRCVAISGRIGRFGSLMILVPVKNLANAKQRLSSVLGSEERWRTGARDVRGRAEGGGALARTA